MSGNDQPEFLFVRVQDISSAVYRPRDRQSALTPSGNLARNRKLTDEHFIRIGLARREKLRTLLLPYMTL